MTARRKVERCDVLWFIETIEHDAEGAETDRYLWEVYGPYESERRAREEMRDGVPTHKAGTKRTGNMTRGYTLTYLPDEDYAGRDSEFTQVVKFVRGVGR